MSTVKGLLLIALILTVSFGSAQQDSMILWRPDMLLSWDNFQGSLPDQAENDAQSRLILTFTATSDPSPSLIIETTATFDPSLSWVNQDEMTLSLLKHEQGHFDICEWYRREFNKELLRLNRLTFKNAEETINTLFSEIMARYNATHDEYDKQTSYSRIRDKQAEWDLRIRSELARLRPYAYHKTRIKLNSNP